jgi:hypothetical protein
MLSLLTIPLLTIPVLTTVSLGKTAAVGEE